MDYKELLLKYMKLVLDCEGTTFLDQFPTNPAIKQTMTAEERTALTEIAKEAYKGW